MQVKTNGIATLKGYSWQLLGISPIILLYIFNYIVNNTLYLAFNFDE